MAILDKIAVQKKMCRDKNRQRFGLKRLRIEKDKGKKKQNKTGKASRKKIQKNEL